MEVNFSPKLNNKLKHVFTTLCLVYICFICLYGIDQFDSGFIPSMIGRLKLGQKIYHDFDYIRPPVTPIFWDLVLQYLPSTFLYFILVCRILFTVQCVIIVVLFQLILFKKTNYFVTLFFLICFMNTFPLMLWHTVDGIFFGAISIFLLRKEYYLSTLILLIIVSLTKQSFIIFSFIMGLVSLVYLLKKRKCHKHDVFLSISLFIFLLSLALNYDLIKNYIDFQNMVFNPDLKSSFFSSSISPYFFTTIKANFLFFIFLSLIYFIKVKEKIFNYFLLIVFLTLLLYPLFNSGKYIGTNAAYLVVIIFFIKYRREEIYTFLLLLLGWSSTISWGASLPTFFIFILLIKAIENLRAYYPIVSIISLVIFFALRLNYPYYSKNIFDTEYKFTSNIPTVSGLLISRNEYNYILDAQDLNKRYPNIIFLPGSPLLDVILNKYPNRASWEMDVEYPSWKTDAKCFQNQYIAIDPMKLHLFKNGFYKSSISEKIFKDNELIYKTKNFSVYQIKKEL